jgi:hypothetical protein
MILVPDSILVPLAFIASGSVRNGNKKRSSRLSLYSAKYPTALRQRGPYETCATQLVLVDFDSLVRSGDPLISALEIYQYGLFAELAPVSDGRCAKVNTLAG